METIGAMLFVVFMLIPPILVSSAIIITAFVFNKICDYMEKYDSNR